MAWRVSITVTARTCSYRLLRFFTNAATQFRERITRYHTTIEEIEKQLSTIDTSNDHSPQLISDAILHQHSIFMALASNVAGLHSEVDQLRKEYTQWYQVGFFTITQRFANILAATVSFGTKSLCHVPTHLYAVILVCSSTQLGHSCD